ncbi:MAG TPA: hypothetical protein VGJ95_17415 [Pseudonocardiaceae bacterium]
MPGLGRPAARAAAVAFVGAAVACAGCADGTDADPVRGADAQSAATPASSPPRAGLPTGQVLPLDAAVTAAVVDPATRTLAAAATEPDRLLLYDLDLPDAAPRMVALPGAVARLTLGAGGELLAPVRSTGELLRIDIRAGQSAEPTVHSTRVTGAPVAAAVVGAATVVALDDRVLVLDGDTVTRTVTGFAGAADVVAVGERAAVLDRSRTALLTVDPASGRLGPGLRAGNGAANAVGDRYGRVLVTDTRDGELLAFSAEPLIMRQRYPVPGAPYAIAYDRTRDLAWVTLTERNEVVGFDVAGGEPVERYRLSTVRQPNAVAVDDATGTVVVASGTGEGIQVVQP